MDELTPETQPEAATDARPARRPVLIHIGYHKTASTWLQWNVFRKKDTGLHRIPYDCKLHDIHPLFWDAEPARKFYSEQLDVVPEGDLPVLSNERLSGHPHSGGYDNSLIAHRLKEIFPDARIFVMVREQRSMILSCWHQYVKKGGCNSLKDYLNPKPDGHVPLFSYNHFAYDRLVALYQDLFGKDNVRVALYEDFNNNPQAFIDALADWAGFGRGGKYLTGLKLNKKAPPFKVWLKMKLNVLIRRDTVNGCSPYATKAGAFLLLPLIEVLGRMIPPPLNRKIQARWESYVESEIAGRYRESNRRLAKLTGLDLTRRGYDTGGGSDQ